MLERKGRSASLCRGDGDRKGMGTDSGKSGMELGRLYACRNLLINAIWSYSKTEPLLSYVTLCTYSILNDATITESV